MGSPVDLQSVKTFPPLSQALCPLPRMRLLGPSFKVSRFAQRAKVEIGFRATSCDTKGIPGITQVGIAERATFAKTMFRRAQR